MYSPFVWFSGIVILFVVIVNIFGQTGKIESECIFVKYIIIRFLF